MENNFTPKSLVFYLFAFAVSDEATIKVKRCTYGLAISPSNLVQFCEPFVLLKKKTLKLLNLNRNWNNSDWKYFWRKCSIHSCGIVATFKFQKLNSVLETQNNMPTVWLMLSVLKHLKLLEILSLSKLIMFFVI